MAEDTQVDDRYKILGRIGSGGMADVYRAQDNHLGREVALKVLHRRFAQDAEFVERFKREAQAAAGLQHPHVVGVFDRGEHNGTYYIAMEHLEGRTLKDIVIEQAPLDQIRVIDLGRQILEAADFAHRHNVIHRDFKPHNVIVDGNDQAKVTDFGIARAGASEMTETGSIMGTAQYLSPEQAQGHDVTAASDVYSIGIMLYEMLTGKLPFEGDSAVSIALKHLSEDPPPMGDAGVKIEPNLERVVMGALAKEPKDRWQSASDFGEALEACRPYVQEFVSGSEGDGGTKDFAAIVLPPGAENGSGDSSDEEDKGRRRWWLWGLIAVLLAVLVGAMAYAFTRPETSKVPDVRGQSLTQARDRLDRDGFENIRVERVVSSRKVDTVLRQNPDQGESAAKDDAIALVVSSGPGTTRVPAVKNTSRTLAIKALQNAGLEVTAEVESSGSIKKGFATRTSPDEGESVQRGSRVTLYVSSGQASIQVPNVVGLTREAAEGRLTRAGLEPKVTERASDDEPDGQVLTQDPGRGTRANKGDTVNLVVAKQQEQSQAPDVTGFSEADARQALRGAGLRVSIRRQTTSNQDEDGQVLRQRPAAGSDVDRGSTVVIVIGRYVAPPSSDDSNQSTTPQSTTPENP